MERRVFIGSTAASALGLTLSGCGSGSEDGLDGVPTSDGKPLTLVGMARLDAPLAGAGLDMVDAHGKSLLDAPIQVAANGLFSCTAPLPARFRLVANSPKAGKVYREVRNHEGRLHMVGINVATHLLALYLDRYPNVALVTAEARVRNYLALPPGTSLDTGLDAQRGPFSSQVFMREAAKAGGFQSYCANLMEYIHMGLRRPFILADDSASPSFGMSVLSNVAGDLVSAPFASAINIGFGWLAQLIGIHLAPGPSLKDISNQLNQVLTQLTAIQTQISAQTITLEYKNAVNAVQPYIAQINGATNALNAAASGAGGATGPVDPTSNTDLNNALWRYDWPTACNAILDYLLGRNGADNIVSLYKSMVMTQNGADSQLGLYQGYPLRSNAVLNQLEQQLQSYLAAVALGVNLYAEVSHLCTRNATSGNFNGIAAPIMQAKAQMNQIIADYTKAAQQLPGPLGSDLVLNDMEYRTTWYLAMLPADTWENVAWQAQWTSTGAYGGGFPTGDLNNQFYLPTQSQLNGLRQRLLAINPNSPASALATLGFQGVDPSNTKLHLWMQGSNGEVDWYYQMEDGTGHQYSSKDQKKNPILPGLVCVLSGFPLQSIEDNPANPLLGSAIPGIAPGNLSILLEPNGPNTTQALANNTQVSGGGTFVVNAKSQNVPVATAGRYMYDVTDYVVWSSSNPGAADISSLADGTAGNITWHPANVVPGSTQVTFTATVFSQPGVQPSASVTLTAASSLPATPTLESIVILPDNLLYGMPAKNEYYLATGFYSDQTCVDLSNQVSWSVVDTTTGAAVPSAQAGFTTSQKNLLVINSNTLRSPNLTIKATLGGVTGNANVQVPIPLTPT